MLGLHEIYGPVVRVAPDELSFVRVPAWKDIYGHRAGGELRKDKKYHSGFGAEPLLLNAGAEDHRQLRRLLAHGFSDKALREQEPIIQQYLNILMAKLHEEGQSGQVALNMCDWYNVSFWVTQCFGRSSGRLLT